LIKGALCNSLALEKKPQLFLCKWINGCKPKVKAAAWAMVVAAFQIDLTPATIPQSLMVWVVYSTSAGD